MDISFSTNNNLKLNNCSSCSHNLNLKKRTSLKPSLNFKARIPNDISKFLDENIESLLDTNVFDVTKRMKFHKIIDKSLPYIMTPENFLNKGRESKVYKISDKYVAKVKRGYDAKSAIKFYNYTKLPDKRFNQLDIYYGEPVIKIGNTEILKNATPTNDFIVCGTSYKGQLPATREEIADYEKYFVPKCSSLPQEAYDKFANGLADLNKMKDTKFNLSKVYYTPDIENPNNILISGNEFRLVDKLEKTSAKEPNSLYTMLEPLLIRLSPESYASYNKDLIEPRYQILQKCLIAAEKADLPLECPLKDRFSNYYLDSIFKHPSSSYISALQELRYYGASIDNRLDYINHIKK